MKKKLLSMFLTLTMLLSLAPGLGILAGATATTDTTWYTGHESDTSFTLSNVAQLEGLASLVNGGTTTFEGKTIKLDANFDNSSNPLATPIGNEEAHPFSGTFDGNGKNVNLAIPNTYNFAGLFGCVAEGGTVKNVSTSGLVSGAPVSHVGGVVGHNKGNVTNCYATCTVSGDSSIVSGGVVGYNESNVTNCYAACTVSEVSFFGGVVGLNESSGSVTNCYCLNENSNGTDDPVCSDSGTITSCAALSTDQMKAATGATDALVDKLNTYVKTNSADGYNYWIVNGGYPTFAFTSAGTEDSPILLKNTADLEILATLVNSGATFSGQYLKLADNFPTDSGTLTTPIGNAYNKCFQGTFDGNGQTVNLEISNTQYAGMFGYLINGATIKNIITTGTVTETGAGSGTENYAGGVVGCSAFGSKVINCGTTVAVTANGDGTHYVGGVVGAAERTVANCYSAGSVNVDGGTTNYAIGGVAGGTVGKYAAITYCYYKSGMAAQSVGHYHYLNDANRSVGVAALTESQMQGNASQPLVDALNRYVTADANAAGGYTKWTATDKYPTFDKNSGWTASGTYIINNMYELKVFATLVNSGFTFEGQTIELADDFDNSGTLTTPIGGPIAGNSRLFFQGTFNGNGQTVNLEISGVQYAGLFGFVGAKGTVKNVSTRGIVTTDTKDSYAGGVVGENQGTVSDCHTTVNVTVTGSGGRAGGVTGYNNSGTITNCSVGGTVTAEDPDSNTHYLGYAGGVAGFNSGSITDCYTTEKVSGNYMAGGIVGQNGGSITRCHAEGDVSATTYAGGVVGWNTSSSGIVTDCYATGKVASKYYAGGVAGENYNSGKLTNCYATGAVTATSDDITNTSAEVNVGGVVGHNQYGTVTNCYASGDVTGSSYRIRIGGVVGNRVGENTITDCYCLDKASGGVENTVGNGDATGCTALPKAQMQAGAGETNTNDWTNLSGGSMLDALNSYVTTNRTADNNYRYWAAGGYPVFAPFDGEGTAASPFVLTNVADLETLAALVNSGISFNGQYLKLDDNFSDTTALTTSIGNYYLYPFKGNFDGNGKSVTLSITGEKYVGLFGLVDAKGTIKNVSTSGTIKATVSNAYAGGVVGWNKSGTVANCCTSVAISATANDSYVGGVVGWDQNGGIVANCYAAGTPSVTGDNCSIGGVVGCNMSGTLSNCYYKDTIAKYGVGTYAYYDGTSISTIPTDESNQSTACAGTTALSDTTMKAASGADLSLLDALNLYVEANSGKSYFKWASSNAYPILDNSTSWTEKTSYTINDVDELELLAAMVNSGVSTFSGKAIKLADTFNNETALKTPIGNDKHPFSGIFDGNGKTVNLNISGDSQYVGLFGYVKNGTVQNVSTTGTVTTTNSTSSSAGGVVGCVVGGSVNNCSSSDVTVSGATAGGVVGANSESSITNCCATGSITAKDYAGGVVGSVSNETNASRKVTVANCYATGNVNATGNQGRAGGVAGYVSRQSATYDLIIKNCYAAVSELTGYNKGGVVGQSNSSKPNSITNCYYLSKSDLPGIGSADTDTCTALPEAQMKAGAGEKDGNGWAALGGYGNVALVDALNKDVSSGNGYRNWGVMDNLNDSYPVFALDTPVYLKEGKAYSAYTDETTNTPITMPAGITYSSGTYTFEDVNLPSFGNNYLYIMDASATINLVGDNQLGVTYDFENGSTSCADMGLFCNNSDVTFTGDGSLTIYDYSNGINANSITIENGTFELNSKTYYGILAKTVNIKGGTINVKGGTAAINATDTLTIASTLEATGQDTATSTDKVLKNQTGTEYVTIQAKQTSSGGGSSKKSTTIPISSDGATINATVTVSGTTATVSAIKDANLSKVLDNGPVVFDFTGLKKTIDTVKLPTDVLKAIAAAAEDADSDTTGLGIKLTNGTVLFDKAALSSIAQQATGKDVTLKIDSIPASALNADQQAAVKDMDVVKIVDIYLTSDNERISDFEGGTASISIPLEIPAGRDAADYTTFHVAETGDTTDMKATNSEGAFHFETNHFSIYVIAYTPDGDSTDGYSDCAKDSTCVYAKFTDANTAAWYHDGVHFCVEQGYMNGVSGTKFSPSGTLSRGMIVTMLNRMEGTPVVNYAMTFSDVEADEWYTEAIRWAQSTELVSGYNDTTFGPKDNVTREQLAAILYRLAESKGEGFVGASAFYFNPVDGADISDWASEAMRWCYMKGILTGDETGALNPTGNATRAEAATMLQRFCEAMEN